MDANNELNSGSLSGEPNRSDGADEPRRSDPPAPPTSREAPPVHALIPFEPRPAGAARPQPRAKARSRWMTAAAALAVGATLASAATIAIASRPEAARIAKSERETRSLAKAVEGLGQRLDSIDSTRSREDIADLRRSLGDIKSHAVSARDLDAALAQLAKRIDSFDREANAKVDKIGERVDRDTAQRTAELAERLDRLEKKAAPAAPETKALAERLDKLEKKAAASPPPAPVVEAKPAQPKLGPNVSMERTGSIDKARPVLRGYVVLDAGEDGALLGTRWGEREVSVGDVLPGAGRIQRIERRGPSWVVETDAGLIPAASSPAFRAE